jgi:hypothetical protein
MLNALFLFSKIFGQRELTKLKTSLEGDREGETSKIFLRQRDGSTSNHRTDRRALVEGLPCVHPMHGIK